ncbi:MAG: diguanylate cyclase [Lachnospiraceae bacterium]|nr:diguanylate cyclase [Lachnospiraceae bacterium]
MAEHYEDDYQELLVKDLQGKLLETQLKLNSLMENMPGGFLTYDAVSYKFVFISKGCLDMFGCDEGAFRNQYYDRFDMLIYKQDRDRTKELVKAQMDFMGSVHVSFRVRGMADDMKYLDCYSRTVTEPSGRRVVYVNLIDMSEQIRIQQELQHKSEDLYIETQRYRLLQDAVDDLVFEYDVINDTAQFNLADGWKTQMVEHDFGKHERLAYYVHPEDLSFVINAWKEARMQPRRRSLECRILTERDRKYVWYRVSYASFADRMDRIIRIVASLKDISKEKQEQESMKQQINFDGMTGVLNKNACESFVQEYLEKSGEDGLHALLIIDADNFKAINDNLGHMFGDHVIQFAANTIKGIFRETDLVGRIGGDEFMVFMKKTTREAVEQKAEALNTAMQKKFEKDGFTVGITCSIGIAFCKNRSVSYEVLFANADAALYEAKRNGRNRFEICE